MTSILGSKKKKKQQQVRREEGQPKAWAKQENRSSKPSKENYDGMKENLCPGLKMTTGGPTMETSKCRPWKKPRREVELSFQVRRATLDGFKGFAYHGMAESHYTKLS